MEKQLTREDILQSKNVYLYMHEIIYVEVKEDEVYALSQNSRQWRKKENFYDYLESSLMMSYFSGITKEEAAALAEKWLH